MKICVVASCTRRSHAKGYCNAHYTRLKRTGNVGLARIKKPNGSIPIEVRFWSKVISTDDCWIWGGTKDGNGYGRFSIKHIYYSAHRVAYEMLIEKIPRGLDLDHLCRTPLCVNPGHLEPVTRLENSLRGNHPKYAAYRNGTCVKGHDRSYFYKKGGCGICNRERAIAYYYQKKLVVA